MSPNIFTPDLEEGSCAYEEVACEDVIAGLVLCKASQEVANGHGHDH